MLELASDCEIRLAGKRRDGKPRFWCQKHQASATGKYGIKLDRCEGSYRSLDSKRVLRLDPLQFEGGVALWGAVDPVYDTTGLVEKEGIHVHARHADGGEKDIDDTFDAVELEIRADLFETKITYVTRETAVSAYIARCVGNTLDSLFCTYCGEPHLDSEWFAVKPHRRHLCHACGEVFIANHRGVSNPLERLRLVFGDKEVSRSIERAPQSLDAKQSDFPGGVQLWASNPALLWTAPRPEQEGIHFHGYAEDRITRIVDETFSSVTLDGVHLSEEQLRYFMAQQSLAHLQNRIVCLTCECGEELFDRGLPAFMPHAKHSCEKCGLKLASPISKKKVVSNPFLLAIEALKQAQRNL
ncbi:MAG: hypothetical protein KGZ65_10515 [Sphingomonadales bacterium]|nr:hypothetical protein [Sphingomonadaceae bacterium]MBS3931658.1 hypothetical protein [Sphingomonadales bacterium]